MASGGHKSSPAVKVAVVAVALSICIMLLAVSIVEGFRHEIREKITGFNAHITLTSADNRSADNTIILTDALDSVLHCQPYISEVHYSASIPILLKTRNAFKGLFLRGVDKDFDYSFFRNYVTEGQIKSKHNDKEIIISANTADKLGVSVGDTINSYLVSDNLRAKPLKIAAIFDTHFEAYDQYYAYADADIVRELASLGPEQISSIEITTKDFDKVPQYTAQLITAINHAIDTGDIDQSFNVITALDQGGNYFAWLDLLDTNVYVILILMTIVSAFTLISGMLIIILERVRFIGVMRALGLSQSKLRRIFILLAIRIGLKGILIGDGIAAVILLIQFFTHIIPLNAEAYFINYVPVSLSLSSFLVINTAFIVIIYLVLILPSQFAGRISPAESMRFED